MSFFWEMEKVIRVNSDRALELATHYFGQPFIHKRPEKVSSYSTVHGKDAGTSLIQISGFVGIIQSDDLTTSDGAFSANFEEEYLYTSYQDLLVGDVITVDLGPDGKTRTWLVSAFENIGYSTNMFVKYKISNRN